MRYIVAKYTVALLIAILGHNSASFAAPKTVCPPFIAEKRGELYYPRDNYRCFASKRAAQKAGLFATRALIAPDYSGWWRWNLNLISNSCGGPKSLAAPTTYFLQLKHDQASGLFGSLCPGNDTFVGASPRKSPAEGFSITSTSQVSSEPFCGSGGASVSYVFEAQDFDFLFTESKTARLTQVKVCDNDPTKRCLATWVGVGGRESTDHRSWPQISNNINNFGQNCQQALTTCQNCHSH